MAFIDHEHQEIQFFVAYAGPSESGIGASHRHIVSQMQPGTFRQPDPHGLFSLRLGEIRGYATRCIVRRLDGLVGADSYDEAGIEDIDGVVLVLNTHPMAAPSNLAAVTALKRAFASVGRDLETLPVVVQCTFRDEPMSLPALALASKFGFSDRPIYESDASEGIGVFEALKGIAKAVLTDLKLNGLSAIRSRAVPTRVEERLVEPGSRQSTSWSLLSAYVDLLALERNEAAWSEAGLGENLPRLIRYRQLVALASAVGLRWEPGLISEVKFLAQRKHAPNSLEHETALAQKYAEKILGPGQQGDPGALLEEGLRLLIRFRLALDSAVGVSRGIMEASGFLAVAYNRVSLAEQKLSVERREMDEILAAFIDPRGRTHTEEELVQRYGYPTDNLMDIDADWA